MERSHTHTHSSRKGKYGSPKHTNLLIVLILGLASIILITFIWRSTSLPPETAERSRSISPAKTPWRTVVPLPPPSHAPALVEGAEKSYLIAMSDYRNADYGKASTSLRLATQAAPQDAELRMYLGSCLLMTRDYGAAAQELRTASQLATGDRKDLALILLAKAQLDRAEISTARETLTQVAMNNGTWSATARNLLEDFSSEP